MSPLVVLAAVFVPMVVEARRAAANERARLRSGGVEAAGDVYATMRIAYPGAFLLMIAEDALRGSPAIAAVVIGAAVFVAAKALKWWAIVSLGPAWTFKLITVPGARLVVGGPYAFLPHPNYIGVLGELVGTAVMTGATLTGPVATAGFLALVLKRISVEERALRAASS